MLQNPGSSFVIWYIDFTGSIKGSRDRNHTSNATGDISVTTRSEKRKRCSFNTYIISLLDMRAISDKLSFL